MFQMNITSNGRRPQILKVEYLSNHWFDHTQILNLNWGDQTKVYKYFKWRWPPVEEKVQSFVWYYGKFIGNQRGNLECGSAQPSLLSGLVNISISVS